MNKFLRSGPHFCYDLDTSTWCGPKGKPECANCEKAKEEKSRFVVEKVDHEKGEITIGPVSKKRRDRP